MFETQVFNYIIGNCDNHLKNYSMTWDSSWRSKSVSPLYDVTCTTLYSVLSRDMGLGIGAHRSIDQIDEHDFLLLARQLGISGAQARQSLAALAESFEHGIMTVGRELEDQYGVPASALARRMADDGRTRLNVVARAAI